MAQPYPRRLIDSTRCYRILQHALPGASKHAPRETLILTGCRSADSIGNRTVTPQQMTLATAADAKFAFYRKQTRRHVFLAQMDRVAPWQRLCALTEPHYPKARDNGCGRRPVGVERTLRVHLL